MDTFASKKNLYAYIYIYTRQREEKKTISAGLLKSKRSIILKRTIWALHPSYVGII